MFSNRRHLFRLSCNVDCPCKIIIACSLHKHLPITHYYTTPQRSNPLEPNISMRDYTLPPVHSLKRLLRLARCAFHANNIRTGALLPLPSPPPLRRQGRLLSTLTTQKQKEQPIFPNESLGYQKCKARQALGEISRVREATEFFLHGL